MKVLTERRCRRREKILATARDLLAKHGYVGVTMRELAAKSNVTPKTLYHQFGNKEKLLHIAVEERFRHTYQAIGDHEVKKAIDKFFLSSRRSPNLPERFHKVRDELDVEFVHPGLHTPEGHQDCQSTSKKVGKA